MPTVAPYGSWRSPIDGDCVTATAINFDAVCLDGDDTYWLASQPQSGGRMAIVRRQGGNSPQVITPEPFQVRNRVHEYGGGAYTVHQGEIYFCNDADRRIYHQQGAAITPRSPEKPAYRYGDLLVDGPRRRLIAVCEDHSTPEMEPQNMLVALNLDQPTAKPEVLVAGCDFYAAPSLSPDGSQLAWLSWNHPHMPWDSTMLLVASVDSAGRLGPPQRVAGGNGESVGQPRWSPRGVLHFVSDRRGWGNLYRWQRGQVAALFPVAAEFGVPHWVFGQSTYGFWGEKILSCYQQGGRSHVILLDPDRGDYTEIDSPYSQISHLRTHGQRAVAIASGPEVAPQVVSLGADLTTWQVLQAGLTTVAARYISRPQAIAFPTQDGEIAYGFYYPPHNPDYTAPEGELPPLLVKSHGGPTAATDDRLNLKVQYWTSRGFGYWDVNYRGSTGYGRAYQDRLAGEWGILDVQDCIDGTQYLVDRGWVDGQRLAISGSSAGGYTVLCALTFHRLFRAGASYYGIGDLAALARDTHKFEAHYTDRLVAPYPAQEQVYRERSPLNFPEKLACPTIFFQGLEDRVVPPEQSLTMVAALRQQKIPLAYVTFPDEQHGFRQPANIKRALEGEFYFYAQIFGFRPAEDLPPVAIEHWPGLQTSAIL